MFKKLIISLGLMLSLFQPAEASVLHKVKVAALAPFKLTSAAILCGVAGVILASSYIKEDFNQ